MAQQLQSYDPSDGKLLGEVVAASQSEIQKRVDTARSAAVGWRNTAINDRVKTINTAYSAAESEMPRLAELLSREMGKDIRRSTSEVHGTIYGGPYIAQAAAEALQSTHIGRSTVEYKPFGTVAVISPWNYPLAMASNLIIPALTAGNCVIWKPSEETPLVAQSFFDLICKSFPEGVIQIVHGDGEQGRMLVESEIDMIAFTGSQAAGKDIMRCAARDLKRLVMELGGNDPMIVLEDADLHAAARFAVGSSFENSGQMCTSTERIYVAKALVHEFEQLVVSYAKQYRVGPWDMEGVHIGPIVNRKQHEKITTHIRDAVLKGGNLLLGEENPKSPYVQPTVISEMTPEMLIEQEETFGPLVCISTFTDVKEAIERANNSSYGLGAVVYGDGQADFVADQLVAGMVGINQGVGGEGDSPWVGAKQSGFGFHGSPDGHKQFAQVRVVSR